MLQLRNITKIYKNGQNEVVALDNVSIDFPNTGMVFVVGKSGAGKTTLLNILGGLDTMNEGQIIINGKSTKEFKAKDFDDYRNHQIGFVFQEFNLIDDLTVKENIAIALKIQAKGHDATTIDEALKLVNLEGLGYRTPRELSGGQKQRISIARALVKNPHIILADEPTGALDSKTGYELMNALKALSNDKLIVIVTHDNEMAYSFADEIIKINDGKIIDHLVTRKDYNKSQYEFVTKNIIKINSGGKLDNPNVINDIIDHNKTNYICLTNTPETITTAIPDAYEKIFTKEDLSAKFESDNNLKEIEKTTTIKEDKKHSRIKFVECLKMAFHQFLMNKGKILFLLLFITLSISIIGFSYSIYTIDNNQIIADTLKTNNIELGMMGKYEKGSQTLIDESNLKELQDDFDNNNFAIGKAMKISYTPASKPSNSAFEMKYFRGIVECEDINSLNLNVVAGNGKFNENSLANHEIIISDYAAYELRRTGYLGKDINDTYGIIKPENIDKQIGTKIKINNYFYEIIGVFDTNFEKYIPLLVSETYVDDASSQVSSLNALKTYYFARIFGPDNFYANYIDENKIYENQSVFSTYFASIPLYDYDYDNNSVQDTFTLASIEYNGYSSFTSWNDYLTNKRPDKGYDVVWGEIPANGLKDNQVIISTDYFSSYNFLYLEQLVAAIKDINTNTSFRKMADAKTVDTIIYQGPIEVVAIVDLEDYSLDAFETNYYNVGIFVSDSLKQTLNKSLYGYDQILFTLNGTRFSYTNTIKAMISRGYTVFNMNGSISYDGSDIEAYKTIALVLAGVMLLFAFLIMMNHATTSIKQRGKEMGVLRATGAKGKDIVKIFAVEEGLIATIISLLSIGIVAYIISVLNNNFGNPNLGIKAVIFDFDVVLTIVLFTFVFFFLTTFVPIIKIARANPVSAMKNK